MCVYVCECVFVILIVCVFDKKGGKEKKRKRGMLT